MQNQVCDMMEKIQNPYIQYMYSYPHKTAYRPLQGIFLEDYAHLLAGKSHGLYLHIPFCQAKCGYCNLFSVTGQNEQQIDRYLAAVGRQIDQYQEILKPYHTEFSEITIGGGTPLLLSERQLEQIFDKMETGFTFSGRRGLVVETAPNQTCREKLAVLKRAKTSRVSMGIQSFSDEELKVLGRNHPAATVREAMDLLKEAEFSCVNVDFIYGIPGQTISSLLASLKEALRYEPDEIFLYPLYVKHGTGLASAVDTGLVLNPGLAFRQYQEAAAFLCSEGFRQDSMRRFVREKGKKAARGFSECGFGTSLALGCGGRSYIGRLHFCTPYAATQQGCREQLEKFENTTDFSAVTHGFLLSDDEMRRRYAIRHLLIRPGIDMSIYKKHFGTCVMDDFPVLGEWCKQGFLKAKDIFLVLTQEGLGLSDYLGPQLISRQVWERMREWDAAWENRRQIREIARQGE